jgi:hypothetical protein
MDELIYLKDTDIIGITVTMNADVLNDSYQVDVFSPSLLTLGTANKIFIIDILKLGQWVELDDKLTEIFKCSPATFTCFGVPTFINYFHQFYSHFKFLQFVPRIIDARIMYHKVQKKGQRSFATIFYILFGKRLDMSV